MFERVETPRLVLRKPSHADAEAIFCRYASDPDVTRLLGWPRHTTVQATHAFLTASDLGWARWPVGPYLVESRQDGTLLGGTGLEFETADCAATGYVFAKDAWRKGYATESLRAVVEVARSVAVVRLYALCHPENTASWRVLEKCGFMCEGILRKRLKFPKLSQDELHDVFCYALSLK
jgi:[ribosomal protein S5]-alanine N-acetyltransferase